MKLLLWVISFFFGSTVFADYVVTVTHSQHVTMIYDHVKGKAELYAPTSPSGSSGSGAVDASNGAIGGAADSFFDAQDQEGMVNAKATASLSMSKTVSRMPTGAKTDASSAFRMSLPFAFGTAAAVILAAIIF